LIIENRPIFACRSKHINTKRLCVQAHYSQFSTINSQFGIKFANYQYKYRIFSAKCQVFSPIFSFFSNFTKKTAILRENSGFTLGMPVLFQISYPAKPLRRIQGLAGLHRYGAV
jgi:hypothetical protein